MSGYIILHNYVRLVPKPPRIPQEYEDTKDINENHWKHVNRVQQWFSFCERGMLQDELSEIFTIDLDQDLPCYDLKAFNPRIIKKASALPWS
jgi:hypothetical protein